MEKSSEIICTACGTESFVLREPQYEGFKKIGEQYICASCGQVYSNPLEVPYKNREKIEVFDEQDRPKTIEVFEQGEGESICRYCNYYVINPFTQWCGLHKKEVEATDSCEAFQKKAPQKNGT